MSAYAWLLSLLALLFGAPHAHAAVRTAVVVSLPTPDELEAPTGPVDPLVVAKNGAQVVAREVQQTPGLSLALPIDVPRASQRLYWLGSTAWSVDRSLEVVSDADAEQVILVQVTLPTTSTPLRLCLHRAHIDGLQQDLGCVSIPALDPETNTLTVEQYLEIQRALRILVPTELVTAVHVTCLDSSSKELVPCACELVGYGTSDGPICTLVGDPGPRFLAVEATGYASTNAPLDLAPATELNITLELDQLATLIIRAPGGSRILVDDTPLVGSQMVAVRPREPHRIIVQKGNRRGMAHVVLDPGVVHQVHVRLRWE